MGEPLYSVIFLIALKLDGFERYNEENFPNELPDYSEYTFVAHPPSIKQWNDVKEYKGGDSLTIYGQEVSDGSEQNKLLGIFSLYFVCYVKTLV